MLCVMNNGCRLEIRAATEMTVTDLCTHLVVIAGLSHLCVMGVEILTVTKHGEGVANVSLAETAGTHSLTNLLGCVKTPLAETPEKLRPEPTNIASDGKISLNPANHTTTANDTQRFG